MRGSFILLFLAIIPLIGYTQPKVPCGLNYGTQEDRERIQLAMFSGSSKDVEKAINRAKDSRGEAVGCPEYDYGPLQIADTTQPAKKDILALWDSIYIPRISSYEISCPEVGRGMPSVGLGVYYAKLGGYFEPQEPLNRLGEMLLATQYSTKNTSKPLVSYPGLYGYYFPSSSSDPCTLPGIAGKATEEFCNLIPELCPVYDEGLFAGKAFATVDHIIQGNRLIGDIGGAGYDQGWAGVFMVEHAIKQADPILKEELLASVLLAAEWAIQHPLVTNHNYTSKLIWLLAEVYAWTGRLDIKRALIDKLNRNLVPGILMDMNGDGLVDGMSSSIPFSALVPIARLPGRNWDAHNALPWYHSMNAWAMLTAYVAFRDQGDTVLAAQYRPYVLAMLDNLAHEVVNIGIPKDHGPGVRDVPFSLLLGIWKLAQYEQEPHPLWEQAVWALWNSGKFEVIGELGLNLPLYLLILDRVPYIPLHLRDNLTTKLSSSLNYRGQLSIVPNPSYSHVSIQVPAGEYQPMYLKVMDYKGKSIFKTQVMESHLIVNMKHYSKGLYLFKLYTKDGYFISRVLRQ